MNGAIAWLARNSVAANLLMVLIVASGLIGVSTVTQEVYPDLALDSISIEVPYLGAGPEEVEEGVVSRIEEAIQGVDGVKEIRSVASEGTASVTVELETGADTRRVVDEVKNNVDAITTFPIETERPIIRELIARNQVADIIVSGSADAFVLKEAAERVRDELSALPEISQVDVVSAPPYEISIEVSEVALRRHGLTFDSFADAVRRSSLDLPGGSVRTEGGEILLRTTGQAYRGHEYENLVLWTRSDGSRLELGDIATVVDGFAETDQSARFNGDAAVMVSVFRSGEQSALDISSAVHRYVENRPASLPHGINLTVWQDQSALLRDRLSVMLRNGAMGFVLVVIVLALFLDLRLACWVSLGIPLSFLGAIALMPVLNVSINMISIFAFILVLGVLVDDAIIVGENIFRHQEEPGNGLRSAIEGAREVAKPVTFAVLTTVTAFLPLLFIPGAFGQMFEVIPLIVAPCLLFSLLESLGILPAHLAHTGARARRGPLHGLQRIVRRSMEIAATVYRTPVLRTALRWRYATAAVGVSILVLAAGMVLGGWTAFSFRTAMEADYITASVTMPQGAPAEATSQAIAALEAGAARLRTRLMTETGIDHLGHVSTIVGDQPTLAGNASPLSGGDATIVAGAHLGEITVELAPPDDRIYTSERLGLLWREAAGPIPEAVAIDFSTSLVNTGADIDLELTGSDVGRLRAAAEAVKRRLAEYAGVYGVRDSFRAGKREMQLGIKPAAETLGLTLQDLGRQVRQGFYGEEVQRIQRGRDDIRVMVRYPRDQRRSLGDLEHIRIRTPVGGEVPFSYVARVEPQSGFSSIRRVNRNRTVNVTAGVDPRAASTAQIVADLSERILPAVMAEHPGVSYAFAGQQADQAEVIGGLQRGFMLAMLAIFALLAVPLRSYLQPLVIMAAIPFGVAGAILGHVLMNLDFSTSSLLGCVALSGIVVNDSLVMIDGINRARDRQSASARHAADAAGPQDPRGLTSTGLDLAILAAAGTRFRPILITSLTTFAGLAPMMFDRSGQAAFFVPMAVSLGFGVLFATFITLILVPVGCLILDDLQRTLGRLGPGA
ncbi:MAG: efflux RND transporter permease subunit [Acidobacteria bacterium]|nr:efflux RND transporter permease subunit [Acidobacteriota bacterium]